MNNMALRSDLKKILEIIEPEKQILDIGCGNGDLIYSLVAHKKAKAIGIEHNPKKVANCIAKGINVIQSDAMDGLKDYPENSFDYVILSITLQEIKDPLDLITEMLRIGKNAIISIKNLGNIRNRFEFFIKGEIPFFNGSDGKFSSKGIYLSNIRNFKNFCRKNKFKIIKEIYLPNSLINNSILFDLLLSDTGIYVLKNKN